MWTIRDFLQNDENLKEETRNQLAFLNTCQKKRKSKLSADKYGNDINSTGSFLHNLSITRSENDFLEIDKPFKAHRKSNVNGSFVGAKRSRLSTDGKRKSSTCTLMLGKFANHFFANEFCLCHSPDQQLELGPNDRIVAQTKVTIPQDNGPIHAESSIQAVPLTENNNCYSPSAPPPTLIEEMTPKAVIRTPYRSTARSHDYAKKAFIRPDICNHCQKKYERSAPQLCAVNLQSGIKNTFL